MDILTAVVIGSMIQDEKEKTNKYGLRAVIFSIIFLIGGIIMYKVMDPVGFARDVEVIMNLFK